MTTMATTTAKMVVSMLLVQLIGVGVSLLSKIALDGIMSPFVMITYRNLIAAVVVCPFCFVFEREMWKVLNWTVWAWIFANAAFGDVLAMGLYFYGLRSTSAAFSSIFQNLIPVATFIIAMVLRTENLSLRKLPGKMKLLGALLCVGGTMMVSMLRGPELHMWRTNLLRHAHDRRQQTPQVLTTTWLSERLVKVYPSTYWMAMLTSLVGSMQCFIVGVFLVHERSEWMLKWDLKLLTVVYSGVMNTGLAFLLISWVISRSGPIYPAMFNSVSLVVTTVLDSVLLGTSIYIGSVLGIVLVVMGMYAFLWGKGTEVKLAAIASAAAQEQEA
ncbi:hypothetical protein U9M48_037696 [Paspalum notatum var. saurae]|uniref:WAT1-related protein n=1 Tax=Paspalum notatum var. saurae TaxID=547442 RepID=A0AAQ3ULR6_PASNO